MKFKFWGVRGSIPSPGPKTVRYGGNTTCIEVRTDDNTLIVLDGGTGIFALAQALMAEQPVEANIFITHSHWDHIHGLPFFIPLFVPGNKVKLHGAFDPVSGNGIEQVMAVQLQYSYFPVSESQLKAAIEYETLDIGKAVTVGGATVTNTILSHPVVDLGYRIDCNGRSLFFTGDHEPYYNIYEPGEADYAQYQVLIEE
ncbi:MAG TPA: MBL fold metallo-hydrolase, partial [Burkholderiaceae bacterium]